MASEGRIARSNGSPAGESVGWLERIRSHIRRRWGRRARRWIIGQIFFVWGLSQLLPSDVLDRVPFLRSVTGPIVSLVPSSASFVGRSNFPQVAEVILCVGLVLAVLNFLHGLLLPEHLHKSKPTRIFGELADLKPPDTSFGAFFVAGVIWLALVPFVFRTVFAVPIFDPQYGVDDWSAMYAYTNRLTFGLFAQAITSLLGFAAAGWALAAGHFIGSCLSLFRKDGRT